MESNHKRFVNFPVCNKEICIQQDWHVPSACTKIVITTILSPSLQIGMVTDE